MEMVNKMPESCYELSLRDLVEVNQEIQKSILDTHEQNYDMKEIREKKNDKRVQVSRNGSINNEGFLLKMAFPLSLGSKRKKKSMKKNIDPRASNGSRTSPRPSVSGGSPTNIKEDWWKKRASERGENESLVSSTNSQSLRSSGSSNSSSSDSRSSIRSDSNKN